MKTLNTHSCSILCTLQILSDTAGHSRPRHEQAWSCCRTFPCSDRRSRRWLSSCSIHPRGTSLRELVEKNMTCCYCAAGILFIPLQFTKQLVCSTYPVLSHSSPLLAWGGVRQRRSRDLTPFPQVPPNMFSWVQLVHMNQGDQPPSTARQKKSRVIAMPDRP